MSYLLRLASISLLAACGADAATPDAGGGAPDAAVSGTRTIDNCTTSIAADAPEFYKRFFRCVTVTKTASGVAIAAQDLPPHPSYYWGAGNANYVAFDTSRGSGYHPNPNTIAAQNVTIAVPDAPVASGITVTPDYVDGQAGTNAAEYRGGPIGVALDGVSMYSGVAAPGDDIAQEAFTFDDYDAHPDQRGSYHYHTITPGPLEVLRAAGLVTTTTPGAAEVELYGVLCDGTVVLGCAELDGAAPAAGLDAQGGHVGDLRAGDGTLYFAARYHVHVCANAARGHLYTPEVHYHAACQ